VNNLVEVATDIDLSSNSIDENAAGAVVGTLETNGDQAN